MLDLSAIDPHMRHYAVKPDGTDYAWDELYGIENYKLIGDFDVNLKGDHLNNELTADTGDDTLDGGLGDDTLTGGEGSDTFVFADVFGHDVITDFNEAEDKLEFSGTLSEADLIEETDADGNRILKTGDGLNSITFADNSIAPGSSIDVTLTVRDRDGEAISGFDVLGIEQADAEELYFDLEKVEGGAFEVSLMAEPIEITKSFHFQIEDQNALSNFEFGSGISEWSTVENIITFNGVTTVTASGVGTGLSANVEHELASFTSSGDGLNLELTEGRLREEIQDTVSLVGDVQTTDATGVAGYNFSSSSDVLISAEEGYENAFPNDHVNELDVLQLMKKLLPGSNETMSQADMIASDFNRDGK